MYIASVLKRKQSKVTEKKILNEYELNESTLYDNQIHICLIIDVENSLINNIIIIEWLVKRFPIYTNEYVLGRL